MRRVVSLWMFLGLSCLLGAQNGSISVGWDTFAPYQIAGTSEPTGIDCDLVRAVAQKAGYTVEFRQLPWARQLTTCQSGELDVVMLASKTPERAKWADWSNSYRQSNIALMTAVSDTNPPASLKDVLTRGTRLGAIRDSYYGEVFAQMMKDPKFAALVDLGSNTESNLTKWNAKRFDYVLDDPAAVDYQVKVGNPAALKTAFFLVQEEVFLMISKSTLAKDPQLKSRLDGALAALKADGTLVRIMAKYKK